jgi:hypothetical protein
VTDGTAPTRIPAACPGRGSCGVCYAWGSPCGRPRPRARPTPTAEVTVKKVLTWLALAFVVFYVISAPESSADFVRTAGHALGDAASSLASFFGSLA